MGFFDLGLSDIVGAAGGIISGITGSQAKDQEYERQREFAQNGVRWRVADAKAAGIHPLAALGNMPSYSPQAAAGTDFGLGQLSQNISRAAESKTTREERQELDDLQKDVFRAQAENIRADTSLKREQTAHAALTSLNSQTQLPPPMPRSRGVSPMSGISADYKPSGGDKAVTLASKRGHVNPDKAYEVYEVPFLGSQLPLATDETSNMMEGFIGEVQFNMRRLYDAVSKGGDTYYDFATGLYRHNKYLHNLQKWMIDNVSPEAVANTIGKFLDHADSKDFTATERQILQSSGIFDAKYKPLVPYR